MNIIRHKRGATFSYGGLVKLPPGDWFAACKLFNEEGLVETLTATLSPLNVAGANGETHALLIEATAASTADWPLSKIKGDIAFINGSVAVLTSTFFIVVEQGFSNG